ncbi:MAG: divalent-cation tolerance protein CutA [Zoogloeaceae bacterium]|jgi:periplasmic divalent cation tolerance protein|nr:divalent-cation tolerance protein CutA [Zoogloeaceae bacterium]
MTFADPAEYLLVITSLPDAESAGKLARALVEQGLAACVNVLGSCHSVYRWQGRMEDATEIPLFIKTTRARYGAVEARIRNLHPYSLPEIIALPLTAGSPDYLKWIKGETEPSCAVC